MIKSENLTRIIFLFLIISALTSCIPRKQVTYFIKEDTTRQAIIPPYEPIIQANDRIQILVTSVDKQASNFFSFSANDNSANAPSYLVNADGIIDIPLVGPFHVAGLTTTQAKDTLKRRFEKYIYSPTVIVTLKTFRITVLGAVNHPGVFESDHERLTITEALALSGDLNVNGKRTNILVVREKGNGKEYGFVDITSRQIITSPYYNLHANDIIYVEPNMRTRLAALQTYFTTLSIIAGVVLLTLLVVKK